MHATIGVYDNHELAIEAVVYLKDHGYPVTQLTIVGLNQKEELDPAGQPMPKEPSAAAGITVGTGLALGTAAGVLTGVGLFAIPGLGVLYGAGALVGAIAGFDLGLMGGGLASVLALVGVNDDSAKKYHKQLEDGKYLVVADGHKEDIYRANQLLADNNRHTNLESHGG